MIQLLSSLVLCAQQLALPEDDLHAVATILRALPPVGSGRIDFVEDKYSPLLESSVQVRGYLQIDNNAVLVKVIEDPFPRRLAIGPERVTILTPERSIESPIARYPPLAALRAGVLGLITRNASELSQVFVPAVRSDDEGWLLELTPRDERLARHLARLRVRGCAKTVVFVEIWYGDGTVEQMRLTYPDAGATK